MITSLQKQKSTLLFKTLSSFVAVTFILTMIIPPGSVSAQTVSGLLNLPAPGSLLALSDRHAPCMLQGVSVYYNNPFQFDFILDTGNDRLTSTHQVKEESRKLIKYFLASLTVPEDDLWVNLSPYEEDKIITESLGQTEMGRDMLAQDYLLKQLSSSLIYPEEELGEKFWEKAYEKAYEQYGTTEIPLNTFNKVWIIPDTAAVYTHGIEPSAENPSAGVTAFVVESRLKVMMEEDYMAMKHNMENNELGTGNLLERDVEAVSSLTADIYRDIILPEIEREVNEGKSFAPLRQIFNSMVLAVWYKQNLRETILGQVYANKSKLSGVEVEDKAVKQKIYNQYLEALKKGVFNYIREDYDRYANEPVPRKYFAGGENFADWARQNLREVSDLQNPAHREQLRGWGDRFKITARLQGLSPQEVEKTLREQGITDINDFQDETIDALLALAHEDGVEWIKAYRVVVKDVNRVGLQDLMNLPESVRAQILENIRNTRDTLKKKISAGVAGAQIMLDEFQALLSGEGQRGMSFVQITDGEAYQELMARLGLEDVELPQDGHASDTYGINLLDPYAMFHELGADSGLTDAEARALEQDVHLTEDSAWDNISAKLEGNFPDGKRRSDLLRSLGFARDIAKTEALTPEIRRQIAVGRVEKLQPALRRFGIEVSTYEVLQWVMKEIQEEKLSTEIDQVSFLVGENGLMVVTDRHETENQLALILQPNADNSAIRDALARLSPLIGIDLSAGSKHAIHSLWSSNQTDLKSYTGWSYLIGAEEMETRRAALRVFLAHAAEGETQEITETLKYIEKETGVSGRMERDLLVADTETDFLKTFEKSAAEVQKKYGELYDFYWNIIQGRPTKLVLTKELVEKWEIDSYLVKKLKDLAPFATAGVRAIRNYLNAADLSRPMNLLVTLFTFEILADMAMEQAKEQGDEQLEAIIAGEVRSQTQYINDMIRRRLAAKGFTVHSPEEGVYLPIGATSFVTITKRVHLTDYDTASHAARGIGCSKVMGFYAPTLSLFGRAALKAAGVDVEEFEKARSEGAQLLPDEMIDLVDRIEARIKRVKQGEDWVFEMADVGDKKLRRDLDMEQEDHPDNINVSLEYANYMKKGYMTEGRIELSKKTLDHGMQVGYNQANGSSYGFNRRVYKHLFGEKVTEKIQWESIHPDRYFDGTGMALFNPKGQKYRALRTYVEEKERENLDKFFTKVAPGFSIMTTLSDQDTLDKIKAEIMEVLKPKQLSEKKEKEEFDKAFARAQSLRFEVFTQDAKTPILDSKGIPYIKLSNGNLLAFYTPELADLSEDVSLMEVVQNSGIPALMEQKPLGYLDETTDPDGDRFVPMQIEKNDDETRERLRRLNIAYIRLNEDKLLVVYVPNQGFLHIQTSLVEVLKERGKFKQDRPDFDEYEDYTFFSIPTTVSSTTWVDFCRKNNIPVVRVPVGFKEIARILRLVEKQIVQNNARVADGLRKQRVIVHDVFGNPIDLGYNPRLIFGGEESGGMISGTEELLESVDGTRQFLGWREKSAVEASVLYLSLFADLYQKAREAIGEGLSAEELYARDDFLEAISLSRFQERIYDDIGAVNTAELRTDFVLEDLMYKQTLSRDEAEAYEAENVARRDANDAFFCSLAFGIEDGDLTLEQAKAIIKDAFRRDKEVIKEITEKAPPQVFEPGQAPRDATPEEALRDLLASVDRDVVGMYFQGDGVFMELRNGGYAVIRPSGTDPKMKGYPATTSAYLSALWSNSITALNPLQYEPELWKDVMKQIGRADLLETYKVVGSEGRKMQQYKRALMVDEMPTWANLANVQKELTDIIGIRWESQIDFSDIMILLGPRTQSKNLMFHPGSRTLRVNWAFDEQMSDLYKKHQDLEKLAKDGKISSEEKGQRQAEILRRIGTAFREELDAVVRFDDMSTADMEEVSAKVSTDMRRGILRERSSLAMLPSYLEEASGDEEGEFVVVDWGGSNLRVMLVALHPGLAPRVVQIVKETFPEDYVKGRKNPFDLIAAKIGELKLDSRKRYALGFTFSFPNQQKALDSGISIGLDGNKGWVGKKSSGGNYDIDGEDVVKLLRQSIENRKLDQQVEVVVVQNDTVGTQLVANADMGVIYGTGYNIALTNPDTGEIINMEAGAFDNISLPWSKYDWEMFETMDPKNWHAIEKMVSGGYIGELARRMLLDEDGITNANLRHALQQEKSFPAPHISGIDKTQGDKAKVKAYIQQNFGVRIGDADAAWIYYVAHAISQRSARLVSAMIASGIRYSGRDLSREKFRIAVDGPVFADHPFVETYMKQALAEIFGEEEAGNIEFISATDGSGIGAAVAAAVAQKIKQRNQRQQIEAVAKKLAEMATGLKDKTLTFSATTELGRAMYARIEANRGRYEDRRYMEAEAVELSQDRSEAAADQFFMEFTDLREAGFRGVSWMHRTDVGKFVTLAVDYLLDTGNFYLVDEFLNARILRLQEMQRAADETIQTAARAEQQRTQINLPVADETILVSATEKEIQGDRIFDAITFKFQGQTFMARFQETSIGFTETLYEVFDSEDHRVGSFTVYLTYPDGDTTRKRVLMGSDHLSFPNASLGKAIEAWLTKHQGRTWNLKGIERPGGIDLNPALFSLQVRTDEKGVPLPLPQQPIYQMDLEGFIPVIIDVVPMPNLNMLLGRDLPLDNTNNERDRYSSLHKPVN